MSNTITIELCTEDRARLDRLANALEALQPPTIHCSMPIPEKPDPDQLTIDDVQQQLAETLARANEAVEAPKNATEETETSTPTTTPITEEEPKSEEIAQPEPTKKVTHADLKAKVIELSAKDLKLKAQARDIVRSYAPMVKDIPEDKLTECYERLEALEG